MTQEDLHKLRIRLECICNVYHLNNPEVSEEIRKLKPKYGHQIAELQSVEGFIDEFDDNFCCFEYAMGLHESATYKQKRYGLSHFNIFCNSRFLDWLIKANKLGQRKEAKYLQDNDLILYWGFDGLITLAFKHAGIYKNGKVFSKWGSGNLYEHPMTEVPLSYGDNYYFYPKPDIKNIEDHFDDYLKELKSTIDAIERQSPNG